MAAVRGLSAVAGKHAATVKGAKVPSVSEIVDRLDFNWSNEKKQAYALSYQKLMCVDLETDKMTVFEGGLQERLREQSGVKVAQKWTTPSRVALAEAEGALPRRGRRVEYRCGGLAAALKALETLHNDAEAQVVFATDGQLSIMDRSGLQGHEHPTQYDEYSLGDLLRAMADNVVDRRDPETSAYRSFSIPLGFDAATARALPAYVRFFLEFVQLKLRAGSDVTELSKRVVQKQKRSLANFSRIDAMTRATVGRPIMHRYGRMYFAFGADLPKLEKGLDSWNKLGIESHMVDREFLERRTLFDLSNETLHAYYIPNDSYFAPDIIETLVAYLEAVYPERFTFRKGCRLTEVVVHPSTGKAVAVRERGPTGDEKLTRVNDVYASLGHDQVFDKRGQASSSAGRGKHVYKEILATSSTGDWVQTVAKDEMERRVPAGMTVDEFLAPSNLLPVADKYNLHLTPICHEYDDDAAVYRLYYRVTEGGVVSYESPRAAAAKGQGVTDRRDLVNTLYKLNRSHIGTWQPLNVGSCSRKIDHTNNRKETKPAGNVEFTYNASGTGVVDAAGKISLM